VATAALVLPVVVTTTPSSASTRSFFVRATLPWMCVAPFDAHAVVKKFDTLLDLLQRPVGGPAVALRNGMEWAAIAVHPDPCLRPQRPQHRGVVLAPSMADPAPRGYSAVAAEQRARAG
jgi:hypothetical protein